MADQSLNKYLPAWRERGIAVINASPLAMGLFRNNGPQPWHPANQDLKDKVNECVAECQSKGNVNSEVALNYSQIMYRNTTSKLVCHHIFSDIGVMKNVSQLSNLQSDPFIQALTSLDSHYDTLLTKFRLMSYYVEPRALTN